MCVSYRPDCCYLFHAIRRVLIRYYELPVHLRVGVMCSGNGTNFENIVRTCREDEVVVMVHNKEKCGAAKRADKLGIPHTRIKGLLVGRCLPIFTDFYRSLGLSCENRVLSDNLVVE